MLSSSTECVEACNRRWHVKASRKTQLTGCRPQTRSMSIPMGSRGRSTTTSRLRSAWAEQKANRRTRSTCKYHKISLSFRGRTTTDLCDLVHLGSDNSHGRPDEAPVREGCSPRVGQSNGEGPGEGASRQRLIRGGFSLHSQSVFSSVFYPIQPTNSCKARSRKLSPEERAAIARRAVREQISMRRPCAGRG